MRNIFILIAFLFIINCSTHIDNDCLIIYKIKNDRYGYTAKYYFKMIVDGTNRCQEICYFVDNIGMYKIGDIIFKSSLSKEIKEKE